MEFSDGFPRLLEIIWMESREPTARDESADIEDTLQKPKNFIPRGASLICDAVEPERDDLDENAEAIAKRTDPAPDRGGRHRG